MFGGRSGGIRETESLAFEMGECYLPPDSNAGEEEEKRIELELRERYFKLPPSKRVNYTKLGVISPFICPWKILLKDWTGGEGGSQSPENRFFVLRNKSILDTLQVMLHKTLIMSIGSLTNSFFLTNYFFFRIVLSKRKLFQLWKTMKTA